MLSGDGYFYDDHPTAPAHHSTDTIVTANFTCMTMWPASIACVHTYARDLCWAGEPELCASIRPRVIVLCVVCYRQIRRHAV